MEIEDATDWISQLPEFIIHHILSYLDSPKQLVRMSVLSKYWFAVTVSFPVSGFNILQFENVIKSPTRRIDQDKRSQYVRDCFFKYVDYTTSRFYHQNVSVQMFKLITPYQDHDPTQVDIIDRCLGLFLTKGVKVLVIGIKDIHPTFFDLPKYRLPNILLSASSLTSMKIYRCELPSSLMVDDVKFKSLKMLELERVPLHDEVIKRLTTSCPLLEKIIINDCEGVKNFCVYGLQNLQEVEIEFGDAQLEIIDIDAPNLWHLWDSIPSKARMEYGGIVDRYSFQYLRQFLDKNIGFKELKLRIDVRRIEVEELMVIQSPRYELEHVELYIKELSVYESILDAVLWCCRPHSLTLEANFACTNIKEWSNIVKFTHEKLLLQEDEGKTNIGILISSSSKVQKHFSDLNSFLTASPRDLQVETITFIKEEVVPIKKKRMIKQSKDINTDVPNCSKSFQITVNGLDEFFDTWSPMHLVGMDVEALKITVNGPDEFFDIWSPMHLVGMDVEALKWHRLNTFSEVPNRFLATFGFAMNSRTACSVKFCTLWFKITKYDYGICT
ncbi:F-box domain, Leucine-rich repeat domain, L domain-like protein [Artemisia annua]|uniref:F-box domain, Leucine-rich repeat domain, L domain-like protein n=1 Tax=Artemisia annua TaxID=35608 RepID=A0A2U1NF02_ARTAN|nr:F-box domain, Leucine-rich repeat domain, L domain-like protein [Artemisia annua]